MSGPFGSSQLMYNAGGDFYPTEIEQSLRFNDNDSAYLSRTPASAGNRKTWTWSGWVKRGNLGTNQNLFSVRTGATTRTMLRFASDSIDWIDDDVNFRITTSAVYRDTSAWYHVVAVIDTTQATSTNRLKLYVNGEQVTNLSNTNYPSQNYEAVVNNTLLHTIGREGSNSNDYFDGYLAEVNFIDGQALDPTDFGEFKSGVWVAKSYSGSYGTNGFYLNFSDSGAIGDDLSGNANDWTANNLAATDVLSDSPTNNFATLNAVDKHPSSTLLNGNLWIHCSASGYQACRSTIAMPSGLWYAEATTGGDRLGVFGIYNVVPRIADLQSTFIDAYVLFNNGVGTRGTRHNSVTTNSRTADAANDVLQCAFNADTGEVWLGRNNTWFGGGDPSAGTSPTYTVDAGVYAFVASGGNGSNQPLKINFGQSAFTYTEPTDFLPLCTANLPDPVIDPAQNDVPADYFGTSLWTGNNSTQSITGLGFQPDLIWAKARSLAEDHALVDIVRSYNELFPNLTSAENATVTGFDSVTSDGFDLNYTAGGNRDKWNANSYTYVGWSWLASNGTSSNTDGATSSTVSANTKAGFSIVSWAGTGSSTTIGHGLDSTPELIINKNRDAVENWVVYSIAQSDGSQYLRLNTNSALVSDSSVFGAAATSSVFTVGTNPEGNGSGNDHIAYCVHSVDGFSKVGTYVGNGSTDGPMLYLGFEPAFFLAKRTDGAENWFMIDNARYPYNDGNIPRLLPNASNTEAEDSSIAGDFLSNGFKIRATQNMINTNGANYIYMAFAENPFKYANAR